MNCEIYDMGNEEKGFELLFDFENGMTQSFYIDDDQARNIIKILANKLNGRY